MKNSTIYIRTLKHAEHTVFCVENDQKSYYDPLTNRSVPYSSGQQIKHSLMMSLCDALGQMPSPITFISVLKIKDGLKEAEVFSSCDPQYPELLIGGWMKAENKNTKKAKKSTSNSESDENTKDNASVLKRRSPLSISAMRALHPSLCRLNTESIITYDRSNLGNSIVIIRDENGKELSNEEVSELLKNGTRVPTRKLVGSKNRAVGLFVQDIALDLSRLFTVSIKDFDSEVSNETEKKLRSEGWKEINTVYGKSLLAPKAYRERVIPALAHAILNWKIQSNQSRTFSLMETLAVGISENANHIAAAIRPKLSDMEENKVLPIVEENLSTVDMFVTLPAEGYIACNTATLDAIEQAETKLISLMQSYDYEN